MGWQTFPRFLGRLVGLVSSGVVPLVALPLPLLAQSSPEWKVSLEFPRPDPERGRPEQTIGAGGRLLEYPEERGGTQRGSGSSDSTEDGERGSSAVCVEQNAIPLTALMPKGASYDVGTTVAANPTLFFYVPETSAEDAEFIIVDEQRNEVYSNSFTLPEEAGVVEVSLPETVSLEVGENYQWELALVCTHQDRSQDKFVQGAIQRTELSPRLKNLLEGQPPLLWQGLVYSRARIWLETLNIAAQLRDSNPGEWEELLKSVGLEKIAEEPFVDCCQAEEFEN